MKCVDCHFLCRSYEGSLTPRETLRNVDRFALKLRAENLSKHTHEFSCAKNLAFSHLSDQPELTLFDLTLGERQCKGYAVFDRSLTLDQMMEREAHKMPTWEKVALVIGPIVGLIMLGLLIWQAVS